MKHVWNYKAALVSPQAAALPNNWGRAKVQTVVTAGQIAPLTVRKHESGINWLRTPLVWALLERNVPKIFVSKVIFTTGVVSSQGQSHCVWQLSAPLETMTHFAECCMSSLPLSHQWDVDTVSSSDSSKWNKPSNQGWDVLQRERGGIKTGGRN